MRKMGILQWHANVLLIDCALINKPLSGYIHILHMQFHLLNAHLYMAFE